MERRATSFLGRLLAVVALLAGPALTTAVADESPGVSATSVCPRCGRTRPLTTMPEPSGQFPPRPICAGCGQGFPVGVQAPAGPSYPGSVRSGALASGATPESGAEATPSPAGMAAAAAATAEAGESVPTGLGEGMAGASGALVMFGDQGTIFGIPKPPGPPGLPPNPRPGQVSSLKYETVLPWVRGFKFSENQSPIPQDRVFFDFNFYNNVNYALNGRFRAPLGNIEVYRYFGGFEKTFLGGLASFGIRDTVNAISARSPLPGVGGSSASMGDLNLFLKFVLLQDWAKGQGLGPGGDATFPQFYRAAGTDGYLVSGGLSLTLPTGPGTFAGAPYSASFRNTNIQPYLGYFARRGDFYVHGFEAVAVPCDARDVTLLYNDLGMGYFVYRSESPDALVSAIAPTCEVHLNVPLNHSNPFNLKDPVGTATTVDFTYGANIMIGRRTVLSTAIVTPVTGPRPYNMEVLAILNYYFGGRRRPDSTSPPVLGN